MALTVSDIIAIDAEGITYINEAKQRRKLLFNSCHQYWVRQATENPDAFLTWDGYPVPPNEPGNENIIGRHNNIADVPYYDFFYENHVRFYIEQKHGLFHSQEKNEQAFLAVEEQINAFGWRTYNAG